MIVPRLAHEALLADIDAARNNQDTLHLWWLGQSGFLVHWQDRHLLIDPYLSDSLTEKYANTDKPHVRMSELVVAPGNLKFVNVITSSHNHTDHLDGPTLTALLEVNPTVDLAVPAANRMFAADRLAVEPSRLTEIDAGDSISTAGITIHAVPAAHDSIERDERGRCRFLGYVFQIGPWTIYHSGDTLRYDGMAEQLTRWQIDIAILPINGRGPERRVAGNLWGDEAAQLARDIGAGIVIPCHYDMFSFNTASPDLFVKTAGALRQRHTVLELGERFELTPDA
ncbi:MAG TPA: MBL fold metallo-hydrolase [Pirellulaceae bacterium]|jgi:L-ascorbate metabolism protein UlaG (beta-lactamase superfamily)|nr:MBL fold metallo-hydrolase [Pirellulaceae bacterium]